MWPLLVVTGVVAAGWSYELTTQELILHRFGVERERLPLRSYEGRSVVLGVVQLYFRFRTLRCSWDADEARMYFLETLAQRAAEAGGAQALPPYRILGDREVELTVPLATACFERMSECVACGAPASARPSLVADRVTEFLVVSYAEQAQIPVPVCEVHVGSHRGWSWVRWSVFVPLVLGIAALVMATAEGAVWSGALFVGSLAALWLTALVVRNPLRTWPDWRAFGVCVTWLAPELTRVRLQVREDETWEALQGRIAQVTGAARSA